MRGSGSAQPAPPSRSRSPGWRPRAFNRCTAKFPRLARPLLREQLSAVNVVQISAPKGTDEARLAVEVRNSLLFNLTGGAAQAPPTHRLKISIIGNASLSSSWTSTRRDPTSRIAGINASYTLTEIATNKIVVTGQTFARVSYDIPGQQQRFARLRGLRDAEDRAAKVIADNITAKARVLFHRRDVTRHPSGLRWLRLTKRSKTSTASWPVPIRRSRSCLSMVPMPVSCRNARNAHPHIRR